MSGPTFLVFVLKMFSNIQILLMVLFNLGLIWIFFLMDVDMSMNLDNLGDIFDAIC